MLLTGRRTTGVRYRGIPVALVVQKFGGTSVADPERIREVADHVARTRRRGDEVVVVVSAMGKETDELLAPGRRGVAHAGPAARWTCSSPRASARPRRCCAWRCTTWASTPTRFTGSQAGFITDTNHTNAKILEVRADRIRDGARRGPGARWSAGAQGVSTDRDVTFLGRGGSDTTAVALAHALGADVCELYTDVSGVFTTDPRVVPDARKHARGSASTRCSR